MSLRNPRALMDMERPVWAELREKHRAK